MFYFRTVDRSLHAPNGSVNCVTYAMNLGVEARALVLVAVGVLAN